MRPSRYSTVVVLLSLCIVALGLATYHKKAPPEVRVAARIVVRTAAPSRAPATPRPTPIPTHTVAPTAAPTAAPVRPAPVYAPGTVAARIAAAWPGDDSWALRVVFGSGPRSNCPSGESGGDPKQYGGLQDGNCCWGLWQFMLSTWHNYRPGNPINYSIEEQTTVAWQNLRASGSGQWSCSPWSYSP